MNLTGVETQLGSLYSELIYINSNTAKIGELHSDIYKLELKLESVRDEIKTTNIVLGEMLRIMKANQTFR